MSLARPSTEVTVVVGAQWGDEGKGKWVDIFAERSELVVRYQGGNNAGHTLYIDGKKFVLHQVPSGAFHENRQCALAAGVVINPGELVKEIGRIQGEIDLSPERLWVSARAHVITPWHVHLDSERESQASGTIGTTKRGIGPTYSEKAARSGLRIGQFVDDESRERWVEQMGKSSDAFAAFFSQHRALWQEFATSAAALRPYVCDAESKIRQAISSGRRVLMEGAQGTLLDIDHGTFPYVTSSSTIAGGACTSVGVSPKQITRIVGIAKAYVTRVGSGPFPTELFDAVGKHIATKGNEFGATTGRPRRCGWFDAVAMRYSLAVNGFDDLIVNKMDILAGVETVKIAVAYRHPTLGRLTELPWDGETLSQCAPEYISLPGWSEDIPKTGKIAALPKAARDYVAALEETTGARVSMVGTGPGRDDALTRE